MNEKKPDHLVWKIAGGIVLGVSILIFMATCSTAVLTSAASAQYSDLVEQHHQTSRKVIAESQQRQRAREAQAQRQQAEKLRRAQALIDAKAIKPGQRCISGQRFERLENGWAQIGSC